MKNEMLKKNIHVKTPQSKVCYFNMLFFSATSTIWLSWSILGQENGQKTFRPLDSHEPLCENFVIIWLFYMHQQNKNKGA